MNIYLQIIIGWCALIYVIVVLTLICNYKELGWAYRDYKNKRDRKFMKIMFRSAFAPILVLLLLICIPLSPILVPLYFIVIEVSHKISDGQNDD